MRSYIMLLKLTCCLCFAPLCSFGQHTICYGYSYDSDGRLLEMRGDDETGLTTTTYQYDESGRQIGSVSVDSSGKKSRITSVTWTESGRNSCTRTIKYNTQGGIPTDTNYHFQRWNTIGLLLCDSFVLDNNSYLYVIYDYRDTSLIHESHYSGTDGVISSTYAYEYNQSGKLVQMNVSIGEYKRFIKYKYDRFGKLLSETEYMINVFGKTEKVGTVAEYQYSNSGNLIRKTCSGKGVILLDEPTVTTYSYDDNNRMISECVEYSEEFGDE